MVIMQTGDAGARRAYIESRGLGRVIYSHEDKSALGDSVCVQYHPKRIPGMYSCMFPCSLLAGGMLGGVC